MMLSHFISSQAKPAHKEQGTVLLTTLLIMAVMAAVSVAIIDDIRFSVKRIINVGDYAQTDWYVKGAEDFAASYITQTLGPLPPEARNRAFVQPQIFTFPFEGGAMTLNVSDGTHCFSLGSLVNAEDGAQNIVGVRQFASLLTALGWPNNDAFTQSTILADWIDRDTQRAPNGAEDGDYLRRDPPHRTANVAVSSVMELRALQGMTEELYQSIRPYLCAREAGELTEFNINTATPLDAFVLSTLLGGPDFLQTAIRLITERPVEGYADQEGLLAAPAMSDFENPDQALEQIIYQPAKLWVEAQVGFRNASRVVVFEFDTLDNGGANLTYRGWGSENLRPRIKDPNDLSE